MNDVGLKFNIRMRVPIQAESEHIGSAAFDDTGIHVDIVIAGGDFPRAPAWPIPLKWAMRFDAICGAVSDVISL